MEQKIELTTLIKKLTFVLVIWICHFYIDANKDLNVVNLKQELSNIGEHETIDVIYNERWKTDKKKQLNGCSPKNAVMNKRELKNKTDIFERKKHSNLEKKLFKELEFLDFLKNRRTISDKLYKKVIYKKCGLRLVLPLFLLLLLLKIFIVDLSFTSVSSDKWWLAEITGLDTYKRQLSPPAWMNDYFSWITQTIFGLIQKCSGASKCVFGHFIRTVIYLIPFIIFIVMFISAVFYYNKKVKKYKKIKFRRR
ncbi:hypothetical protein MKS88_000782 [Plasmodium brasilianum]|uniref:Uncharacterized protein n=1 Tax=Plasmodium brasilianum TaxID=5824 RepID=A0ACB9YHD8_PLABR|nr:hypothetical protein MKS88_000782 [Plasmodium brasilianum]